jgi:S1-C subfamily serine protease
MTPWGDDPVKKLDCDDLGLDFAATDRGLEVSVVKPGGVARRVGLKVGDVIVTVFGYPATRAERWEWLTSGDNGYVRLGVLDGKTQELVTRYVSLNE